MKQRRFMKLVGQNLTEFTDHAWNLGTLFVEERCQTLYLSSAFIFSDNSKDAFDGMGKIH